MKRPIPPTPPDRLTVGRPASLRDGRYVLYWMHAHRRSGWNFALQHAARRAQELGLPLLVLEALRADYPWASARHHTFVIDGMADNAAAFATTSAAYFPYVEPTPGAGKGLIRRLAADAALVVTDDSPSFFLRRMVDAAATQIECRLELVDSNGLLPVRLPDRTFKTAYSFRAYLQKALHDHLDNIPLAAPLADRSLPTLGPLADEVRTRWPQTPAASLTAPQELVAALPIDPTVGAVAGVRGGAISANEHLDRFLAEGIGAYNEDRNVLHRSATSSLSPYLHYGHISSHEIVHELARHEGHTGFVPEPTGRGQRQGWWRASAPVEAFLDQLVTWRELGFNMAHRHPNCDRFESLPEWAQCTLAEHAGDARPYCYSLQELEEGRTHDELWNAAQAQLRREGCIHNYLRMLWGKKILEWSATPEQALAAMLELNNKYALDGRDPNSTSGICWILGRYDRAWGPERPIFGKVRYMSSENTARKMRVQPYIDHYGASAAGPAAGPGTATGVPHV